MKVLGELGVGLKLIGKVKIRWSNTNSKRGAGVLQLTIPHTAKLFFPLKVGEEAEVYVDEENRRIIYQLLTQD